MISFMLGAYWDARPDSLEKCAENAERFFARLAEVDPLMAHWFEPGRSRKDALKRKVDIFDAQSFRALLLKGRSRSDIGREIFEDLGFSFSLWNGAGEMEEQAAVSIHCGCYNERLGNNVLIDLPYKSDKPRWVEKSEEMLAMVAEIWRPKWAGVMSKKARRERRIAGVYPFVDWMVYVPRPIGAVPFPSRVRSLDELGSIVIVQPDPPSGDDAEELSRIRRVESILVT